MDLLALGVRHGFSVYRAILDGRLELEEIAQPLDPVCQAGEDIGGENATRQPARQGQGRRTMPIAGQRRTMSCENRDKCSYPVSVTTTDSLNTTPPSLTSLRSGMRWKHMPGSSTVRSFSLMLMIRPSPQSGGTPMPIEYPVRCMKYRAKPVFRMTVRAARSTSCDVTPGRIASFAAFSASREASAAAMSRGFGVPTNTVRDSMQL